MVPWRHLGAARKHFRKGTPFPPISVKILSSLFGAFLEPGGHILRTDLVMFFGYPSGTTFLRFWSPKGIPNGGFWRSIWRLFLKTRKPRFSRPLTRFRQVEGVRFGNFFDTFSRLFLRCLLGGLRRRILRILGSPWRSVGEPFGAKKSTFLEVRF